VHIISGGDDEDQRKDGDYLAHDDRYERTDEYVDILKWIWTSDYPLEDAVDYGRELIPLVRQEVARRETYIADKRVAAG